MPEHRGTEAGYEDLEARNESSEVRKVLPDHFESAYELRKNCEYRTENGCEYKTDSLGRIRECSGKLCLDTDTPANKAAQRRVGGEDRHTGEKLVEGRVEYDKNDRDDGGHLIARMFGGSPEVDNLVAMNYHVNRGEYKNLENKWKSTLQEKDREGNPKYDVDVKIQVKYEGESKRPSGFLIRYAYYDRQTGERVFYDMQRIKNEGGSK